jgi:hypothetical protein
MCENVFYLEDTSDNIFVDPTATITHIVTAAIAQLVPHYYPSVAVTGCTFEDVRTVPFGGLDIPITPVPGTKGGGVGGTPASVCLAVKKNTGNLGRSGRGRWFWPVSDSNAFGAGGNFVTPTFLADVVTALTNFQNAIESALLPATMGIVSYQTGGAMRSAGLFQQITSFSTSDSFIDSQRRRLPNRGR